MDNITLTGAILCGHILIRVINFRKMRRAIIMKERGT